MAMSSQPDHIQITKDYAQVDEWQHRPLEAIYPIFMDATVLKIKRLCG